MMRCYQRNRQIPKRTAVEFIRLVVTIQNAVTTLARWNTLSVATAKLFSSASYTPTLLTGVYTSDIIITGNIKLTTFISGYRQVHVQVLGYHVPELQLIQSDIFYKIERKLEAGHSIECMTHAGHSVVFCTLWPL